MSIPKRRLIPFVIWLLIHLTGAADEERLRESRLEAVVVESEGILGGITLILVGRPAAAHVVALPGDEA